ncbi:MULTISPECIES: hypothetical protein [unclassified Microcoleus]|uniref:hypothetical protein n=1 Tax=unclassified Microcoleus TaxID=2642155 RepID=UPI001DB88D7E|nr:MULTISPECIES: hypothetical protein [unclassified Microcoleus]MCC3501354.1 hypothetical protein [Microcoleus sp. PH2017_19_SFW_U_A]TAG99271.1 MAG: hypothetical protein EAZ19_00495 [Oscillatoriales cyanobacterium]MCC3475721.1 hypothetical protein [Microcoleus sp. PH2017_13_LAR_U_A]MCC3488246.1 hypothetical protein [Microcoleus sp. PH2017_14_LAR_D_A]MCC3500442.1 hypothetical protein [Microcoleus sp. PH2017_15_JOR_U_A]
MFADYGQQPPAQPSFVEIPNPCVTTTMGRIEVTDVRSETLTGRLLDDQDKPIQEDGQPVYVCVRKSEILYSTERDNMMNWWELGEQAVVPYMAPRKYSLESLINRLDGLNSDELYVLRTFVCLESDPFKAYSGSVNNDLSHLQLWFPTVRVLDRVEQNQLASALCWRIASESNAPTAPTPGDGRDD